MLLQIYKPIEFFSYYGKMINCLIRIPGNFIVKPCLLLGLTVTMLYRWRLIYMMILIIYNHCMYWRSRIDHRLQNQVLYFLFAFMRAIYYDPLLLKEFSALLEDCLTIECDPSEKHDVGALFTETKTYDNFLFTSIFVVKYNTSHLFKYV